MGHYFLLSGLLFFAAIGQAVDQPAVSLPSTDLGRLEKILNGELQARAAGRVSLDGHRHWLIQFRKDLETKSGQLPPSPANIALHAKILSRLGDSGAARAMLDRALQEDPGNSILRTAQGYTQFDQKNYAAATAAADAVLKKDPKNKDALWLKHSSEGRHNANPGSPAVRQQAPRGSSAGTVADETNLPVKLVYKMPPKAADIPTLVSDQPASPTGPSSVWWWLTLPVGVGMVGYGLQRGRQPAKPKDEPNPVAETPKKKEGHLLRNCAIVVGAIALGVIMWECAPLIIEATEGLIVASTPSAPTMVPALAGAGSSGGGAISVQQVVVANAAKAAVATTAMAAVTNAVANRSHSSSESGNSSTEKIKSGEAGDTKIPSDAEIEEMAERIDPVDKGKKLTKAGRSLSKHNSDKRSGSTIPKPNGDQADLNEAGKKLVDSILKDPNRTTTIGEAGRFGKIIEIRRPDGIGIRIKPDGEFVHFIE